MSAIIRSSLAEYDCWADSYPPKPHNPLMRVEQQAMIEHCPDIHGVRALDLACGTGRYGDVLAANGAARIVSVDLSAEMLRRSKSAARVRGDMMHLPFACGVFDFIISGLAVGHASDLGRWMREAGRVLVPGGTLLYSDFHPSAAAAGMTRSFRDLQRRKHNVPHRSYAVDDHRLAAVGAELIIDKLQELRVGVELRERFPGSDTFYHRWRGLPVVLIVRARKALASE